MKSCCCKLWDAFVFPTKPPTLFFLPPYHHLSLTTSGCTVPLLSLPTRLLLGSSKHPLYSQVCNTQPLLTPGFLLILRDNLACMSLYTQDKDLLFSCCVYYPPPPNIPSCFIWLLQPFWSWSDRVLNAMIMNGPRGVFASFAAAG